jgi:hypothetical protein
MAARRRGQVATAFEPVATWGWCEPRGPIRGEITSEHRKNEPTTQRLQ